MRVDIETCVMGARGIVEVSRCREAGVVYGVCTRRTSRHLVCAASSQGLVLSQLEKGSGFIKTHSDRVANTSVSPTAYDIAVGFNLRCGIQKPEKDSSSQIVTEPTGSPS